MDAAALQETLKAVEVGLSPQQAVSGFPLAPLRGEAAFKAMLAGPEPAQAPPATPRFVDPIKDRAVQSK